MKARDNQLDPSYIEQNKPKTRLINKTALVLIAVFSLSTLWFVAPTKLMLIQLIEQSASPQVSLAFLNQLYEFDPKNRDIVRQIADKYIQLGQLDDARRLLESMLIDSNGERDWQATDSYLAVLLAQYYNAEPEQEQQATDNLLAFFNQIDALPDAYLARRFADAAIGFNLPLKGLQYLYPHLDSGITDYDELISLALQGEDYDTALSLRKEAFQQSEDMPHATALFDQFTAIDQPQLSKEFIEQYQGALSNDPDFLKASIDHSEQVGNLDVALKQLDKLVKVEPEASHYRHSAEIAVALGELSVAASSLEKAIELEGDTQDYQALHQIYRWQDDIKKAQEVSIALLPLSPTEEQLRNGLEDSRALSDIYYEGVFLDALAKQNLIRPDEYNQWLNAIEKSQGTEAALRSVIELAQTRPNDSQLISHKMRLYSYQNDSQAAISQWRDLIRLRSPTQSEALIASDMYLMQHQPQQALNALTAPQNWLNADDPYLNRVAALAWETSNRPAAVASFNQLAARQSEQLDVYRYVKVLSPLDSESREMLVTLYNQTDNDQILLMLIAESQLSGDSDSLRDLVQLAANDPSLARNLDVLNLRVQLALQEGQTDQATELLHTILDISPNNPSAVNSLMWIAIDTNDQQGLSELYDRYKLALADDPNLWLAFATANQQLGNLAEADLWYKQLLLNGDNPDVSILLNYATLLEKTGQLDKAYELRKFVLNQRKQELLASQGGDASYRSLIAMFTSPAFAQSMIELAATTAPSAEHTAELYSHYLANNQTDRLLYWHQNTALGQYPLPDWQKLALAMKQNDKDAIERLLANSVNLSVTDKYAALQKVGQQQAAWDEGENLLGTMQDEASEAQLLKMHAQQNPDKNRSLRGQVLSISSWDITRYSLDFFAPHPYGFWRLGSDYQQTSATDNLLGNELESERRLRGVYHQQFADSSAEIGFDIADGVGDQRLGLNGHYQFAINEDWQAKFSFGLNSQIEASKLLTVAGQDNTLGFSTHYKLTSRESLSLRLNYHDLKTRFDDPIGQGWDMNLRVTEQLFFNDPAWQAYADISTHKIKHDSSPLTGFNQWYQGSAPITSSDFIADRYQRLSIGQRLYHGTPGLPGPTVPSPRYWLDTSLGYNTVTSKADVTLSAGLGWEIIGSDELYLTTSWQSQDRNGTESLRFTLGYYYGF
ncbi:tetratricopeptide repeat protein [Vibrio sp.]|uniref:tetratricopeptide repeat protein n=1 Tax=Vibrio sp. TaxID=678 RepID=UPI003D0C6BB6